MTTRCSIFQRYSLTAIHIFNCSIIFTQENGLTEKYEYIIEVVRTLEGEIRRRAGGASAQAERTEGTGEDRGVRGGTETREGTGKRESQPTTLKPEGEVRGETLKDVPAEAEIE